MHLNYAWQCPTTIVPFFGDQFFWGDRIYEIGLGPAPIPIAQLNVENLCNSIRFMLQPEVNNLDFPNFHKYKYKYVGYFPNFHEYKYKYKYVGYFPNLYFPNFHKYKYVGC